MAEKKNLWRSVSRRKARCHALSKGARNFFLITRIELGTSKRCTINKLMRSNAHIATVHDSQKVILTDIFSKLILVRMFCLPSLGVQRKCNLLQWVVLGIFWTAGTVFTCRALFSQRTDSLFYHTLSPFLPLLELFHFQPPASANWSFVYSFSFTDIVSGLKLWNENVIYFLSYP